MALDVYFREDIANVLRSVNMAGSGTTSLVNRELAKAASENVQLDAANLAERLDIYEQGYLDALKSVAAAFGILPAQSAAAVPDLLAAHNQADDVSRQVLAQSWKLSQDVSI